MIIHLSGSDFRRMPWANGKGSTTEMLRVEHGGHLSLRLSRAMFVEDGPFSVFPGIERNLTVLSGAGFDLVGDGIRLRADMRAPVQFAGDISLRAVGVSAVSEDFNVMTECNLPLPEVFVQGPGQVAGPSVVLALEAGRIGPVNVAQHDLIVTDRSLWHDVPVIVVRSEAIQQYLSTARV